MEEARINEEINDLIIIQDTMNRMLLEQQPKIDNILSNLEESHTTSVATNEVLLQAQSYHISHMKRIAGGVLGGIIGLFVSPMIMPIGIVGGIYLGSVY